MAENRGEERSASIPDDVEGSFGLLDLLRVLLGVFLASEVVVKCVSGSWWVPAPLSNSGANSPDVSSRESGYSEYWAKHNLALPHDFTIVELSRFSGDYSKKLDRPILLAVNRTVFDVSSSPGFYGEWGAYKKFTGKDCSNNFQFGMFDHAAYSTPCHHDISDFDEAQLAKVREWYQFFASKYPSVGRLVVEVESSDLI
ncbi:unnamed protein product [Kluyveromyces dobzhanskii CBS 2104]|uniref:WGS project CCBQ000000000 data, contig 00016 n=1 Tax=Kluyveromyces dobzhanskii CBS 2104 TaxID=1427455 RepID=A0A0A8L2B0_9SACH|nr:unnamed protein product [Kluyveromyces dobzhanskii CBS 2104]